MSPILSAYISKYGYIAIFSLVFLQEIGVPNPVPNELVLLFSGYLTSVGKLDFLTVLIIVTAADTLGSSLLYMTFYCFGQRLLQKWSHVLPTSKLAYLTARVSHQDRWSLYVGRLIPFIRGYTAAAAGLLKIPPSAPSSLDFGVEPFQFHAGVFDTKLPIDTTLFAVRLVRPGCNFSLQYGQCTDAAVA